ncbi:hypothetical protein HYR69_06430 [Candidatus Sumerlaeota bacterium]|nr:hypothetical protein [Candidatus Sumerlaeota bacterium]MBI3737331.1 hypothetical protein [Candidatus Sumerlaeota bacterium]
MDSGLKNGLKIGGAVLALIGSVLWLANAFSGTRVGSAGNNGSSIAMPTPPPAALKVMEKMMQEPEFAESDWTDPAVRARGQMDMMKAMSGEDRETVREVFSQMQQQMDKMQRALGPDQARQMMERMRQRMPQMFEAIRKQREASHDPKKEK